MVQAVPATSTAAESAAISHLYSRSACATSRRSNSGSSTEAVCSLASRMVPLPDQLAFSI